MRYARPATERSVRLLSPRFWLVLVSLVLGACRAPTSSFHDPCDQGIFFLDKTVTVPVGQTITMFVWRGGRGISFMGGGTGCGRVSVRASWKSSNVAIATVRASTRPYAMEEEVEIRGIAVGEAEITARADGRTVGLIVNVVAP